MTTPHGYNPYATGNKVYNGGSSMPTQGAVDPSGYVEREMRKRSSALQPDPNGNNSSGLAVAATRRLDAQNQPNAKSFTNYLQTPISGYAGVHPVKRPDGTYTPVANNPTAYSSTATDLLAASTGVPTQTDSMNNVGIPYDATFADTSAQLNAAREDYLAQAARNKQTLEQNYTTQARSLTDQQPELNRSLLSNAAARGIANSSGYAYGVGETQRTFSDQMSQLQGTRTQGLADLDFSQTEEEKNYALNMELARQAAVRRLAQQAGDLGLGDPEQTPNLAPLQGAPAPAGPHAVSNVGFKNPVINPKKPAPKPVAKPTPKPTPTSSIPNATYRYGSRGSGVTALQRKLGISADGIYGNQTRAAVVAFQKAHHLTPDGVVGPNTLRALAGVR